MSCKLAKYGPALIRMARAVPRPWLVGPEGHETWAHPFAPLAVSYLLMAHESYLDEATACLPSERSCNLLFSTAAQQFIADHRELPADGPSCLGDGFTNGAALLLIMIYGAQTERLAKRESNADPD